MTETKVKVATNLWALWHANAWNTRLKMSKCKNSIWKVVGNASVPACSYWSGNEHANMYGLYMWEEVYKLQSRTSYRICKLQLPLKEYNVNLTITCYYLAPASYDQLLFKPIFIAYRPSKSSSQPPPQSSLYNELNYLCTEFAWELFDEQFLQLSHHHHHQGSITAIGNGLRTGWFLHWTKHMPLSHHNFT